MRKKLFVFIIAIFLFSGFAWTGAAAAELSVNRNYTTYRIVYGDTLSRISRKFSTSVAYLKSLNNLRSDLIYSGQSLKVPSQSNVSKLYYTVQSGDTLWAIANRLGVTVNGIKANNRLTSNTIYVVYAFMVYTDCIVIGLNPASVKPVDVTVVKWVPFR